MLPVGVATQAKPPQTVKKQYGRRGFGDQSATGPLFPIGLRGPVASSTCPWRIAELGQNQAFFGFDSMPGCAMSSSFSFM
jgi:hypothetical protein